MHGSGYASGSGSAWRLIRIQDPDLDPHHCFNKLMLTMLVIFSSECPPEDFLSFTVQTSDLHCSFSIAVLPAWTSRVLSSLPLKPPLNRLQLPVTWAGWEGQAEDGHLPADDLTALGADAGLGGPGPQRGGRPGPGGGRLWPRPPGSARAARRGAAQPGLRYVNPHLRGRGTKWYSQLWMAFSPKVPMYRYRYKNSDTICIPSPKCCLYTYIFLFWNWVS